jgi:hypothetical protein
MTSLSLREQEIVGFSVYPVFVDNVYGNYHQLAFHGLKNGYHHQFGRLIG